MVFIINFMKANSTKFQAIGIGKKAYDDITSFNIDSIEIKKFVKELQNNLRSWSALAFFN